MLAHSSLPPPSSCLTPTFGVFYILLSSTIFVPTSAKSTCVAYCRPWRLQWEISSNVMTSHLNRDIHQLSRNIYDFAFDWAMRAENSQFWKGPRKTISRSDSLKENAAHMRKGTRASIRITPRSEEYVWRDSVCGNNADKVIILRDDLQLQKLQQLGMNSSEEGKLLSLRDHISKSASATNRFASLSLLSIDDWELCI